MIPHEEKLAMISIGLGERLKLFRLKKNLVQAEFAEICGIDRKNLSKIENGRRSITDYILYNLVNYFPDFDANYILTGQKRELKTAVTEGVEH
jgi:transcriptional regulator with XRE-family HTH domain